MVGLFLFLLWEHVHEFLHEARHGQLLYLFIVQPDIVGGQFGLRMSLQQIEVGIYMLVSEHVFYVLSQASEQSFEVWQRVAFNHVWFPEALPDVATATPVHSHPTLIVYVDVLKVALSDF